MGELINNIDSSLFSSEEDTLKWFDNYLSDTSGSISTSAQLFKKYYQKCVHDLVNLKYDPDSEKIEFDFLNNSDIYECNYIDHNDIDQCINNQYHIKIISILKNNAYLRETCVKEGILTDDDIKKLISIPDDRMLHLSLEEIYLTIFDKDFSELDNIEKNKKLAKFRLSKDWETNMIVPLLKIHRLNNLQIKYAHTARVVYLTDYELNSLNIKNDTIRNIALTSALFHDVGRFYQGAFYNGFGESSMVAMEGEGKGHAEAGYYYSLLNMICLNTLGVDNSEDLVNYALASFVVKNHQIPNFENQDFEHLEKNYEFSSDINKKLLDYVLSSYMKALPFENGVHSRFGSTIPHQQKYMKKAFESILDTIEKVEQQYVSDETKLKNIISSIETFLGKDVIYFLSDENIGAWKHYTTYEMEELKEILPEDEYNSLLEDGKILVTKELNDKICEHRTALKMDSLFFFNKEEVNIISKLDIPKDVEVIRKESPYFPHEGIVRTPELNRLVNEYKRKKFCEEQKIDITHYGTLLETAGKELAKYAQFDIADTIMRDGHNKTIDPEVQKVLNLCLNLVMDADKLDILIQRVNKRWENWNPKDIKVCSNKAIGQSFIDVLEYVYGVPIKRDNNGQIILDSMLKKILLYNEQTNTTFARKLNKIVNIHQNNLSSFDMQLLDQFLSRDHYLNMVTSKFKTTETGDLLYTPQLLKILMERVKKDQLFQERINDLDIKLSYDLVGTSIPNTLLKLLDDFKIEFVNSNNNYVSIPYSIMKEIYPDDTIRMRKEMSLILPEDLREKVFALDQNRGSGNQKFPLGKRASNNPNFLWNNVFPAIWWHIDQFIMTNLRLKKSYEFIIDTSLLDRLKDTYSSSECLPEFSYFIDEIIDYAKVFVQTLVDARVNNNDDVVFGDEDGDYFEMTDYHKMIQIRDEASRRWHIMKQKDSLSEMFLKENEEIDIPFIK